MYSIERKLAEREAVRRKVVSDKFMTMASEVLIPWLHKIAYNYKSRNGTHMNGMSLLPQYYNDVRDKEIAALVGILVTDKDVVGQVLALKNLLGESPWDWFRNRGFVEYGTGLAMKKKIYGMKGPKYISVSTLSSALYDASEEYFQISRDGSGMMNFFLSESRGTTLHSVLSRLFSCIPSIDENKLRWLRIALEDYVWGDSELLAGWDRRCPITKEVTECIRIMFPENYDYGPWDDCIRLFGFDDESDFFYACKAFKELSKTNPLGYRKMSCLIPRWYWKGDRVFPVLWKRRFPWMFE